jgi:hypothetical protein
MPSYTLYIYSFFQQEYCQEQGGYLPEPKQDLDLYQLIEKTDCNKKGIVLGFLKQKEYYSIQYLFQRCARSVGIQYLFQRRARSVGIHIYPTLC